MNLYERAFTFEKLSEHVKTKQLQKHCFAVEGAMRHYGQLFNEDPERYAACGLLHDIDFEEFPEQHPGVGLDWLKAYGYDDEFVTAVKGHGSHGEARETQMAKTLFAVDELASFIVAAALVRPTKFEGMEIKSVKKKMKDKAFAAAVNREMIKKGAEELGVELDVHLQNVLDALIAHEAYLNTLSMSLVD
ncbi:MAG: HAD family hydrolase [Clostridia bacterium]|nr:HAD family hydrolase [Clostridia bacterium]